MVHNEIEYALMASYAEGLDIIKNADAGLRQRGIDAETAPLEQPEYCNHQIDTTEVAEVWGGSVIASWLLDLTADGPHAFPNLDELADKLLSAMRREFAGHVEEQA
jgi:6-phosphogluconate dehydrogenase